MRNDIGHILYSEEVIAAKVNQLGKTITEDYAGKSPEYPYTKE